jgi:hypothetical protein
MSVTGISDKDQFMSGINGVGGGNPIYPGQIPKIPKNLDPAGEANSAAPAPNGAETQPAGAAPHSSPSDATNVTTGNASSQPPATLNIVQALQDSLSGPNPSFSANLQTLLTKLGLPVAPQTGSGPNVSATSVAQVQTGDSLQANQQFIASLLATSPPL